MGDLGGQRRGRLPRHARDDPAAERDGPRGFIAPYQETRIHLPRRGGEGEGVVADRAGGGFPARYGPGEFDALQGHDDVLALAAAIGADVAAELVRWVGR